MIIDGLLQFDPPASAVTVTRPSTNVIDLLNQRDLGESIPPAMQVYVGVDTLFTSGGGTGTLVVQMQGSSDNVNWFTYAESRAFTTAELAVVGRLLSMAWPSVPVGTPGSGNVAGAAPRYLRLNYVVAAGPMTAGKLNAQLVLDAQSTRQYPAGITIQN